PDRRHRARRVPRGAKRHRSRERGRDRLQRRLLQKALHHEFAAVARRGCEVVVLMRWFDRAIVVGLGARLLFGCVPDVEDSDTRVSAPRVLAVRAEPPEAEPRAKVKLSALYADHTGTLSEGKLDWALCLARKSLAELGPISRACLVENGKALDP